MTEEFSFESIWNVVVSLAAQGESELYLHDLGPSIEAGKLLAGADRAGRFSVLVPLLSNEAFADQTSLGAIDLSRTTLQGKPFAAVTCTDVLLNDVFVIFVRDMVQRLPVIGPCAGGLIEHVGHWRELFAEAKSSGLLSLPQTAGLLAELLTLERILIRDPKRGLEVWSGPLKSQHDFRSSNQALEVKATLSREGTRTSVSSVEQLNPPGDTPLHLSLFKFQVGPGGHSLPETIRRIKGLGVDRQKFELLLLRAGYRTGFEYVYNAYTLEILDEHTFDVRQDAFPRIVPGSFAGGHLPFGVEQLSYVIDLAGCLSSALTSTQLDRLYGSLAEGLI